MSQELDAPNPRLTVTIDGEDHEIFMSFGLVAELANLVGSVERVVAIDLNPELSILVIDRVLAPRDKRGKMLEHDYAAPPLESYVADQILNFAGEHMIHFFIRGLQRGMQRISDNKTRLAEVGSLLTSTPTLALPNV